MSTTGSPEPATEIPTDPEEHTEPESAPEPEPESGTDPEAGAGSGWVPDLWARLRTSPGRVGWVLGPAVIYALLGMLRIGPVWKEPTRLVQCGCGDAAFTMFYLGWTPYAINRGHDPFFTDWLFFPTGVNTLWNVTLPLPGVLLAPLTAWGSVILSYNVLIAFAFGGTALSAYLVLRRWVSWPPAAFAGGLLYGFSPYMTGQGLGHAHMLLLVLVPVMLLLLDEILVRQRLPFWLPGVLLGGVAVAQLLTAEEVLAGMAVMATVGLLALMALFRGEIRAKARYAATGLGVAAGTALLLAAYPLQHQLTGPQRLSGTVSSPDRYRADLLSWVVPTKLVRFAPESAVRTSSGFFGNNAENGSYLGIPLLLVAVVTVILLWRRRPVVRWAGVVLITAMVLACGRSLVVDGRDTGIWLPFQWLEHLPLLESLVSVRLSSYAVLMCALLLAVGTEEVYRLLRDRVLRDRVPVARPQVRTGLAGGLAAALAVLTLVPLLPDQPSYGGIRDAGVPAWYTSAAVQERVPAGSVLVTVPAATPQDSSAMVWQSVANYRFKSPFGYSLHPGPDGKGQFTPYRSTFLGIMARIRRGPQPRVNATDIRTMRTEFAGWQVRTVVASPQGNPNLPELVDLLSRIVGRPPVLDSGSWVWYDIDSGALAGLPAVAPPWPPRPVTLPPG